VPAECVQPEPIAEQPARRRRHDDGPGIGESLQARCQVRRLADDPAFLRLAFADQVADHDEAGGDADANPEPVPGRPPAQGGRSGDGGRVEPSDRGDGIEAGAHGPLGIIFVGARKAEINQHAVAHVFGDEAVEAANRLCHAPVIGADHLAQLFGIEPRRQRRRADQVAEHQRQLSAFRRRARRGLRCRSRPRAQAGNGLQDLAAMTDRGDAEFLQIVGGQARQQFGSDVVLLEGDRVLLEAKRPQPPCDIHCRLPRQLIAG
jgi:hypothetical protein